MKLSMTSLSIAAAFACLTTTAVAQTNGELFVTRFADAPNVGKINYSYANGEFTVQPVEWLYTTVGADGIAGNPQAPGHLFVGGQYYDQVHDINTATGVIKSYDAATNVYHLSVVDDTTVYGTSLPGSPVKFVINANGSLSGGSIVPVYGDDPWLTTIINTPAGMFYTSGNAEGAGGFGRITFDATGSSATTSRILTDDHSFHGGAYDPYTGHIFVFGDEHISQIDLAGNIVSQVTVPQTDGFDMLFDQGTVDGEGHIYIASNTGHLVFIDYSASKTIGDASNYVAVHFISYYLDDVAPLVGAGSTTTTSDPETGRCNNGFGNGADCNPRGLDLTGGDHSVSVHQDELGNSPKTAGTPAMK